MGGGICNTLAPTKLVWAPPTKIVGRGDGYQDGGNGILFISHSESMMMMMRDTMSITQLFAPLAAVSLSSERRLEEKHLGGGGGGQVLKLGREKGGIKECRRREIFACVSLSPAKPYLPSCSTPPPAPTTVHERSRLAPSTRGCCFCRQICRAKFLKKINIFSGSFLSFFPNFCILLDFL